MNDRATGSKFHPLPVLIFGAICISFAPIFVKLVGEARLGPTAIGFWRVIIGSAALFLFSLARGKGLALDRRLVKFAALAGFIFFLDLFVWHRSVIYCGAGMSTILGNTQVFMTAILSFFIFKEKLTVRFWIAAISAIGGVALLVGLASDEVVFTERYLLGVTFGLATGIAYSNYLITLRWSTVKEKVPDIVLFMAWTAAFSTLFLGASVIVESVPLLPPDAESWLWLIALGLIAQALGWWVITWALSRLDASRAGLVLLLQPTLAMVWGVLMFSEQFTSTQALGAAVTLAAIYFGGLRNGRKERPRTQASSK